MIYVALLRGINVGGNAKVEMPRLKESFEKLGFTHVKTYINSGNVVFSDSERSSQELTEMIEREIKTEFGLSVSVIIRDLPNIIAINNDVPERFSENTEQRTYVIFLQADIARPNVIKNFPPKENVESIIYTNGALVWNIKRKDINHGSGAEIIKSDLYKKMTMRNINTVRKLLSLMQEVQE